MRIFYPKIVVIRAQKQKQLVQLKPMTEQFFKVTGFF